MLSTTITFGSASAMRAFIAGESIAPPEPKRNRLEMSYDALSSWSASMSGRAIASPTIPTVTTFSRSTMLQISCASILRCAVSTSVLPPKSVTIIDPQRGAVHERSDRERDGARTVHRVLDDRRGSVEGARAHPEERRDRREEEVLLRPHDALRHPSGATGVEDVEVVLGARREVAVRADAAASAASYSVAPIASRSSSEPSSTATNACSFGSSSRTATIRGTNSRPWTRATRSALSNRYRSSAST